MINFICHTIACPVLNYTSPWAPFGKLPPALLPLSILKSDCDSLAAVAPSVAASAASAPLRCMKDNGVCLLEVAKSPEAPFN